MENDTSKTKLIGIYIIVLWLLAICYTLPKGLSIKEEKYEHVTVCGSTMSAFHEKINTILKWILSFAFPYLIIIVNSILLLKFLTEWSNNSNKLKYQAKSELQTLPLMNGNIKTTNSKKIDNLDDNKNQSATNYLSNDSQFKSTSKLDEPSKTASNSSELHVNKVNANTKTSRAMMIKRRTTRFVLAIVFSFLCCW
jgi:hypothetical protein